MRAPLVLVAVLLAGCAQAPPVEPPVDASFVPERFDHVDAPWVAYLGSGCGLCGSPESAYHWDAFLFEDGRAALFWWDGARPPPDNVTYDRAQVAMLHQDATGRDDVVQTPTRVHTGRADAALVDALRANWTTSTTWFGCTDFSATYAVRHANGTLERQRTTCLDEGDPFARFADPLWDLQETLQSRGARQG